MNKILKSVLSIFLTLSLVFSFVTCASNGGGNGDDDELDFNFGSATPSEPKIFNDTTAFDFVKEIKIGWNLGNTFDANPWSGFNKNSSVRDYETLWVKHVTNKSNIDALKAAGFNAIRIPVSWAKVSKPNNQIRADWMRRVTEVVNYAADNGMYIILNTHHDEDLFKFTDANVEKSLKAFERIWKQIATNFQNYDEKLIFEGLNEPRTPGSQNEWNGGTPAERANINRHHQVFVDTVRSTGGNNDKRFLLIATYGASAVSAAIDGLTLPNDTADKKLIVSIHSYSPYNFALNTNKAYNTWSESGSDVTDITSGINRADTKFVKNGIPVIIGEFGAMNKNNDAARAAWAKYYVSYAKSKGMPCFWWDNAATSGDGELFGLLNRTTNAIIYPNVLQGLMDGLK